MPLLTEEIGNNMHIAKFVLSRPYVYHLSNRHNLEFILETGILYSTEEIANIVKLESKGEFLTTRRRGCINLSRGKRSFHVRDQDPLSEVILSKCLETGWTIPKYVALLNSKVFFWPTVGDLEKHYARYERVKEDLIILRLNTEELFSVNKQQPKFCHLNSGGPRASSWHDGKGSPRGSTTFRVADEYPFGPSTVREVTFERSCKLPSIMIAKKPLGPFKKA